MKVLLPSHGILGQRAVELEMPTFGVIHKLQSYNQDDVLLKHKLVELISNADFNCITEMDVDYLYTIAMFAMTFNMATFKPVCRNKSCGSVLEKRVNLQDLEIVEIKLKRSELPFIKRVKGIKFSYNIISAQQYLDAYEYSQFEEDTENAFQDAQVALIMGREVSDREFAQALPISVYASAFLFQRMNFHGLKCEASIKCPACGTVTPFQFKISPKLLTYDVDKIMSRFASVSDVISFEGFMSMSVIDYNAFVTALNNHMK